MSFSDSQYATRVCRPEQYRIKTIIYRSLLHFMSEVERTRQPPPDIDQSPSRGPNANLYALLELFDFVLQQEFTKDYAFLPHVTSGIESDPNPKRPPVFRVRPTPSFLRDPRRQATIAQDDTDDEPGYNLTCDFCGSDIFQSFFECHQCSPFGSASGQSVGDGLIICPACYVEGRTCRWGIMEACQLRPFDELLRARERAFDILLEDTMDETSRQRLQDKMYVLPH